MPPKFRKSLAYAQVSADTETEVLDAYADVLTSSQSPDLLLKNVPEVFRTLKIQKSFTKDVLECIEWFYATQQSNLAKSGLNWAVASQLLRHLTISLTILGRFDVSDVVDIDKLVVFCNRLVKFRDHYGLISQNWSLFVEAAGNNGERAIDRTLTLQDLIKVKGSLQLDDISDSILIDMLGCGRSNVDGEIFNYKLTSAALEVGIKDFAEVLGLLGEYD